MNDEESKIKICAHISPEMADFLEAMKTMGKKRNIPNISWNTAFFLRERLQLRNIENILEIGPANGFSTMMLALSCPGSQITSVECSRHAFEELRHNLQAFSSMKNSKGGIQNEEIYFSPAEFGPKVTSEVCQIEVGNFSLYYADARELLPAFLAGAPSIICSNPKSQIAQIPKKHFDFIFIDGAFRMTREFFDLSLPLLSEGGLIILDDAIKYRSKMDGFHEYLESGNIGYEMIQTDEDDGVMVIDFGNNSTRPA